MPAIVQWTGAAANGAWSDPLNWSGASVPTSNDQVVIAPVESSSGPSPSPFVLIDAPVVVESIDSQLPILMAGANSSLRLTAGQSRLTAGLKIDFAGLAVQGASTRLIVSGGTSSATSGLIVATEGAGIEWAGLNTLDNMVLFMNVGASIAVTDVVEAKNVSEITVRGGRFAAPALKTMQGGLISVIEAGKFEAVSLADASGTFIETDGAGTSVELPSLTKFDKGRFRADAGAAIAAPALKNVVIGTATAWSFSWYVGENSRLSLPSLSAIDVGSPSSSAEAQDARILLRGNAQLQVSSVAYTAINGALRLSLDGNARIFGTVVTGTKTVLTGSGTIVGSLDNSGLITPSGDFSPYGTISVTGDFVNRPTGTIDLQMGGASKLDRLFVSGHATILGGALKIALSDEFANPNSPMPTGSFELMKWRSWAGQFATTPEILPRADRTGLTSQSRYEPTAMVQVLGKHRTDPDLIFVADTKVKEGNLPTGYGIFTIRRSGPMTVPITVHYEVIAGTAKPGVHFSFPKGPITFAPGETERQIRFVIKGNKTYHGDVTFRVRLTSVSERGELGQTTAQVTIQEDDPAPIKKPTPVPKPPAKPAPKPPVKPVPPVRTPPRIMIRPRAAVLIAKR